MDFIRLVRKPGHCPWRFYGLLRVRGGRENLEIVCQDIVCLAIGDGLTDRGFELESVPDAVTDFLYEDTVAAKRYVDY